MAFVPAVNTVKTVLVWDVNGVSAISVLHVRKPAGNPDVDDHAQIASIFGDWFEGVKLSVSNQIRLSEIRCTTLTNESDYQSFYLVNAMGAQGSNPQPMPNNVAIVQSWQGGMSGRSTRGRTYWPFVNEGNTQQNFMALVDRNRILQAGADLLADLLIQGFQLVVASYFGNKAPRATALLTPIITTVMNTRVDSQRRRLPTMWS